MQQVCLDGSLREALEPLRGAWESRLRRCNFQSGEKRLGMENAECGCEVHEVSVLTKKSMFCMSNSSLTWEVRGGEGAYVINVESPKDPYLPVDSQLGSHVDKLSDMFSCYLSDLST